MNKIIGFLISREEKCPIVDFFNAGLTTIHLKCRSYSIYLWGTGDINQCIVNCKYSLSFPLHNNLLDRNVILCFEDENIIIENDWLGSIPIFYNTKEIIISTLPNLCVKNKEIHQEGLKNFCEFGYSVFEQTFFKDVRFLRYYSKLIIDKKGLTVEYKDDLPLEKILNNQRNYEEPTIDLIKTYIQEIEGKLNGEIIIPTSGGYDSRLLNFLIKDKSRIRSFTYGISENQTDSYEVVFAKKLSEILGTEWQQIKLAEFYKYINHWFGIYGISTHLHGMYHIEFYQKIFEHYTFSNPTLLSGIFGDVWAGSINYKSINCIDDLIHLGYTHGLSLNLKYLRYEYKGDSKLKQSFFNKFGDYLKDDRAKTLFTIRLKIILISYLLTLPDYFGVPSWTPFLNLEIANAMLNMEKRKRESRIWQRDFFKKFGLNLEDMNLKSTKSNKLDYKIAQHARLELIDIEMMKKYVDEKRLQEINTILSNLTLFEKLKNELIDIRKVGGVLRRLGFKNEYLKALYEYCVIKAIEKGLKNVS